MQGRWPTRAQHVRPTWSRRRLLWGLGAENQRNKDGARTADRDLRRSKESKAEHEFWIGYCEQGYHDRGNAEEQPCIAVAE
jgi:hypothetical protein